MREVPLPVQCLMVADVLKQRNLQNPELEMLAPNEQSYRALLLQPSGPIVANEERIGHLRMAIAEDRCKKFLTLAAQRGNHLVVVPEYCLPVSVLIQCATSDLFPAEGAVWVLGCESITPAQLDEFKSSVSEDCIVIAEDDGAAAVQGTYFDAIAYCFVTKDNTGTLKKVVLFQFKTCPSRDDHFFENKHLRTGRTIYQFKGAEDLLGLSAVICSDAFTLGDDPQLTRKLTDRSTLIHIQLNPNPRHPDYRKYRTETFSRSPSVSDCDILCLNWARHISQHDSEDGPENKWKNIGGSTWYLPRHRCSTKDEEVANNDANGVYYSLLDKHRHVLLFHYDEAIFELTVPKIVQLGPAVLDNRLGPQADGRFTWSADQNDWKLNGDSPQTGLDVLLSTDEHIGKAFAALQAVNNRLSIERAIALSCGDQGDGETWYNMGSLKYCQMKVDEVVPRTTFCLDPCEEATTARHERVQRVATLNYILENDELPPQIRDLTGGHATITWDAASPNTNIAKTGCQPALVAYLGNQPLPERLRNIADAAVELLRKEGKSHQRRVAVCYRKIDNSTAFVKMSALTRIDYDGSSLKNITGPLE